MTELPVSAQLPVSDRLPVSAQHCGGGPRCGRSDSVDSRLVDFRLREALHCSQVSAWAVALLNDVGLSATRPRVLVLAALRARARARPVTAGDLYQELGRELAQRGLDDTAPGLTTIYRALTVLTERGVLHTFHRDMGASTAYRLCHQTPHHHVICRCCGRVQEHPARPLEDWLIERLAPEGFSVETYHAELVGLCATCLTNITDQTCPGGAAG